MGAGVTIALRFHQIDHRLTSTPVPPLVHEKRIHFPRPPAGRWFDPLGLVRHLSTTGGRRPPHGTAILVAPRPRNRAGRAGRSVYALCPWSLHPWKKWAFVRSWSEMRDGLAPTSPLSIIARALACHYFWLLINLGLWGAKRRGFQIYDLEDINHWIGQWDQRLRTQPWLTGNEPGFVDFAFLGHLECMSSGLTDELIPLLRQHAAILDWLERLTKRLGNPDSFFTKSLLNNHHSVPTASASERALFWVSWVLWMAIWPISLPILLYGFARRRVNPAHPGPYPEGFGLADRHVDAREVVNANPQLQRRPLDSSGRLNCQGLPIKD